MKTLTSFFAGITFTLTCQWAYGAPISAYAAVIAAITIILFALTWVYRKINFNGYNDDSNGKTKWR